MKLVPFKFNYELQNSLCTSGFGKVNVTGVFKFLRFTPDTVADTTCRLSGDPRREFAVFSPFSMKTLLKRIYYYLL